VDRRLVVRGGSGTAPARDPTQVAALIRE